LYLGVFSDLANALLYSTHHIDREMMDRSADRHRDYVAIYEHYGGHKNTMKSTRSLSISLQHCRNDASNVWIQRLAFRLLLR